MTCAACLTAPFAKPACTATSRSGWSCRFDYRYDNGRPHLMQRVGLAEADKSTWDRLHSVEVNFLRLTESNALPDFNPVALVKMDRADARLVRAVDERLRAVATVIDVADQDAASSQLWEMLHPAP